MTRSAALKRRPRRGYGSCPDPVAARSAVRGVYLEADAGHSCRLARNHFPRLQRPRAAQCYRHPGFDGFGSRRLWGHFPNPGVGPALWRPDSNFQRADAQRFAPACEVSPMTI
jgi:hypothetical protein